MEKINFINNTTPALNSTNLNKLQDNVEDAIQEVQNDADSLNTNKLDKTSIKNIYTESETETYGCDYVNGINTYSTNEIKTGETWIDGKPIYKKVYVTQSTNDMNLYLNHNLTNLDRYWLDTSNCFLWDNSECLPSNWYYGTNDWGRHWMNKTQIRYRNPNALGTGRILYSTVKYTKTTD